MNISNSNVSIYIDDTSVRVMVTHGKRITRLAEMGLETSLSNIDSADKENELAGKIRHLLKFNKIGQRKIILGLSGLHCLTRPVVLPELPKAMLGEAVVREAKRILPVPLEQLYLSWHVISETASKTNIFLVAVPRQTADLAIRLMNKAGYKPYLMGIKPIALARLPKEPDAMILDVQQKEFDIVIMINGIPQPVRTVSFPKDTLPLAEKMVIVKEEFRRTLEFVRSKTEEPQVKPETKVYVSGELASQPELFGPLGEEFGYKVAPLSSPLKYLKYLEPSQYLVNAGLVLKEITKESGPLLPNFNSLPEPYQPRRIPMNKLVFLPAGLAAVGVLVLLALTIQNTAAKIDSSQTQLNSSNFLLQKKQAQKKEMIDKVAALEQQVKAANTEYDTYVEALKQITGTGNNLNTDLVTAIEKISDGLTVTSIALNNLQLNLAGFADDEESVFRYVRSLMGTGRFKEIVINGITVNSAGEDGAATVSFSLGCTLEVKRK